MDDENAKTEPAPVDEDFVRRAYDAWWGYLEGMVPMGMAPPARLPTFDQLSSHVRGAWDAAIGALVSVEGELEPESEEDLEELTKPDSKPVA